MQGFARFVLPALILIPSLALAQDTQLPSSPAQQTRPQTSTQQAPEVPKPQTNPATQSNLPNAPSSIVTGKPHLQGQVPLEDIPHPPVDAFRLPLNVAGDTYRIFTSPIYIRGRDLRWILPMAAVTGISLSQDSHVARYIVSHNPGFNNTADNVSYDLMYSYIAGPVVMYGTSLATHNDHLRESGLLGGEALIDSEIFDTIIKLSTFRERPTAATNYDGKFYQTSAGIDSSFISGHSILAWSSAAVLAAEYPSPWHQAALYTGAGATALTRVLAEKHFPTDVLLGSAAGWLIGHYVVRAHHHFPIYRHHGHQPLG
ncbi:MAG TPA: phosphatase PAP2 family protein [Candidatus Aquilonibacter sp.]|nr:phosphatase PAP2 family protein [Candidatus Aquilonibacter sp.]